ncbi:MAG TPA: hypothetical protein VF600_01895 [Abditibacteriaceae bacterium]|jgi:hypothetical protein
MKMTTDRTTKAVLTLVAAGLWGALLRPLFVAEPAKAQVADSAPQQSHAASPPLKPPVILKAQQGIPYVVLSEGYISVWYLGEKENLDPKTVTGRKVIENTKLFCVDSQPLPTR